MIATRRLAGLVALAAFSAAPAGAAILGPPDLRLYPDVSAGIRGTIDYAFNSQTGRGVLRLANVPYMIAGGPYKSSEFGVAADSTGALRQTLNLVLDADGRIVDDPLNSYELRGSIRAGGETFDGLLLRGVPVALGSQDLGPAGLHRTDIFDARLHFDGGALAPFYQADWADPLRVAAYLRFRSDGDSTFGGRFDEDFAGDAPTSFLVSTYQTTAYPIPEPAPVVILAMGIAGWIRRRR